MLSAENARESAENAREKVTDSIDQSLKEIFTLINEEAKEGKIRCFPNKALREKQVVRLQTLGYKLYEQGRGYIHQDRVNFSQIIAEISWEI